MARTNIDIDEDACLAVMDRYALSTKREAVNFALRSLAPPSRWTWTGPAGSGAQAGTVTSMR